jgi:hypothetical protein
VQDGALLLRKSSAHPMPAPSVSLQSLLISPWELRFRKLMLPVWSRKHQSAPRVQAGRAEFTPQKHGSAVQALSPRRVLELATLQHHQHADDGTDAAPRLECHVARGTELSVPRSLRAAHAPTERSTPVMLASTADIFLMLKEQTLPVLFDFHAQVVFKRVGELIVI